MQGRHGVKLKHPLRSFGGGNVGAMDAKGREPGPDDAEAVLDLPGLDELTGIDRDRYSIVGIDLRVDGPNDCHSDCLCDRPSGAFGLEHSIARQADIAELGQSRGELPVVGARFPRTEC